MFVAKEVHFRTTLQKADWPKDVLLSPVNPISPATTAIDQASSKRGGWGIVNHLKYQACNKAEY